MLFVNSKKKLITRNINGQNKKKKKKKKRKKITILKFPRILFGLYETVSARFSNSRSGDGKVYELQAHLIRHLLLLASVSASFQGDTSFRPETNTFISRTSLFVISQRDREQVQRRRNLYNHRDYM